MSKSQMVRSDDVRALLRIMGELRELSPDVETQGQHLIDQFCTLCGTEVGFVHVLKVTTGGKLKFARSIGGGAFDDRMREVLRQYLEFGQARDPLVAAYKDRMGETATHFRDELVSDRDWYRSAHAMEFVRGIGLDMSIAGVYAWPEHDAISGFGLHRLWGEGDFGMREWRLIDFMNRELGWFYRRLLPLANGNALQSLSPRLRQTLDRLLAGLSEKQIAQKMDLSRHTVHDHVKALHNRLEVSNRAELMAKAFELRAGKADEAQLTTEPGATHRITRTPG